MKILISTLLTLLLPISVFADTCSVVPAFSPTEKISKIIISQIIFSKKSIYVAAYGISNHKIVDALIMQKQAGLDIVICVDKLQSTGKSSLIKKLINAGIPVYVKKSNTLQHNKYIIYDDIEVTMGSWNLSNSADKQDNSIVIIYDCPDTIRKFKDDFTRIYTRDK